MNHKNSFISVLCQISTPQEMSLLLEEILTPREQHDLLLRWQLMQELYDGKPQRQIASELGISLCKITRGAKVLKNPNSISVKLLKEKQ